MSSAATSPEQPLQDQRKSGPVPAESVKKRFLPGFVELYINGFKFQDIVSARHHSEDFRETRSGYIVLRLRFMAFFYAVSVPLWIPFDYLLLRPEHSSAMVVPRLLLSAFLLLLGCFTLRKLTSLQAHANLVLTFVATGVFYFASMLILDREVAEPALAGYSLMPLLMVAMLGVFPLTLDWAVVLIVIIVAPNLALETVRSQLLTRDTANMIWIFLMLGGISMWVQSSQLLMLLKLYRESTQDPLTGLINRRVLMKRLDSEIERLGKEKQSFCILMFDLDRFKRINDNYGHLTGDKVLKTTANILQKGLREHDIIARFGGEEFVAVLHGCKSHEAIAVAERIRASCHATQVTAPNGDGIQLSTSVGVTEYEPGEAIETTLNRVDESLYKAKELGRNRVVHSQSNR